MSNSPLRAKEKQQQLGLDHLVEAATALTQLVNSNPASSSQSTKSSVPVSGNGNQVSDDDSDAKSKQSAVSSLTMSSLSSNASGNGSSNETSRSGSGSLVANNNNAKEIFPRRLFKVLSDHSISDIITWLPHGRAFVILKTDELAATVLPRYFPESCSGGAGPAAPKTRVQTCKYPSFTRKLNRWGFRQVTRGPDSGAFHHKYFVREEPRLCDKMVCQRSKRRKGDKLHAANKAAGVPGSSFPANSVAFLGPYSAALRQQAMTLESETTCSDAINANLNNNPFAMQHHHLLTSFTTKFPQQDQPGSIVSMRSCNVHTPPPTNQVNVNGNDMNNINSGLSSSQNSLPGTPLNTINSPMQNVNMTRTVSTNSSSSPNPAAFNNVNSNMSLNIFNNQSSNNDNGQLNQRLLLAQVASGNSVPNFNSHNNNVANLASSLNHIPSTISTNSLNQQAKAQQKQQQTHQHQAMPNFITFFDKHAQNNNNMTQQQLLPLAPQQNMQMHQSQTVPSTTNNNMGNINQTCANYHTPILPVGAPPATVPNSTNATANNYHFVSMAATGTSTSSPFTNNANTSSNATVISSNSIPCNASNTNNMSTILANTATINANTATATATTTSQNQQHQSEAEVRAANAKTLLYNAYLKALG
jgi:hypothetical protein